jgi:hypothetical protein
MTISDIGNMLIDHPPAIEWKNLTRPPHRPHNIPWGMIDKHSFCFHVWNNDIVFSRELPIKLAVLPTILIALAWIFVLFLVINLRHVNRFHNWGIMSAGEAVGPFSILFS